MSILASTARGPGSPAPGRPRPIARRPTLTPPPATGHQPRAAMERLQRTCAMATDAITRRYFAGAEATEWHGVRA